MSGNTEQSRVTAAQLLVRCLEAEGIRWVFGVPGEENADFQLALEDSELEFVLTRHEQGAAFMATAVGQLTDRPALCFGTLGPGATNLVTGVADANLDRIPLLVLTAQAGRERRYRDSHQVTRITEMMAPVTKWSASLDTPETIPEMVRKAVRLSLSEPPGAVHLELPEDVAAEAATGAPLQPVEWTPPRPAPEALEAAWTLLFRAERPILLAGNGIVRAGASTALRRFAESAGIGACSTFMAKGVIDDDSELSCFTIGMGQRDFPDLAVEDSDLVIAAGYDLVEYPPSLWNRRGQRRLLHLHALPAEIESCYRPDVEVVGELGATLTALAERCEQGGGADRDREHVRRAREAMRADFERRGAEDADGGLAPQTVLAAVREALGPADLLFSDVGAHKMWIARQFPTHEPNTCRIPNGHCSMGSALPAAIGAKLVRPERRVLAIAGDGGFLMNVQEMESAKRLGTDVVVMVWEDGGYGLISWKQEAERDRHGSLAFDNPDFTALAEAFGWRGLRCETASELRARLEEAFAGEGPCLLSLPIDYRENMELTRRLQAL